MKAFQVFQACEAFKASAYDADAADHAADSKKTLWMCPTVGGSHSMRNVVLAVALVTLSTGCATMAAYQAEQAKWQGLADQATAALGASPVTVLLKGNTRTGQYIRLSRTVELGTASDEAAKTWLLAHELGHHIRGHVNAYLEQEMEANVVAVRILQVWGQSEEDAVRLVGNRLLSIKTTGSTLTGKGHDWCAEFADLRSHYPQYTPRDPAKVNGTCPGTGG